jgi:ABC-type Fe3+-siderophore transport system permease subunit
MIAIRVLAAAVLAAGARFALEGALPNRLLLEEVHAVGAYLGVLGALFSIIVAFLIYVVWDQFNRVQIGIAKEGAAIEDLCRVAAYLSNRGSAEGIRAAARNYLGATTGDEPKRLALGTDSKLAEERFGQLCRAVRSAVADTPRDETIYNEALQALNGISDARDERLSMSATRIPRTLWGLIVVASLALLGGFFVLGFRTPWLSAAVTGATAGTLAFLLAVVKDMDNPFLGAWNVTYEPMAKADARIGVKHG